MDDHRAQRIGGLVLAGGVLAAAALVLIDGMDWRDTLRVQVYMEHAGPLTEGAPMIAAGREIGTIERVGLIPASHAGNGHPLEDTGGVALHVAIESRYAEMTSIHSEIFLERRGVFGRPYLAVGPPPPSEPWERSLRDGDTIRGVDPARLDRVLRRSTASAVEIRALVAEVEPSARKLGLELAKLGETLRAIEPEEGSYARAAENLSDAGAELAALAEAAGPAKELPLRRARGLLRRSGEEFGAARAELAVAARALERARGQLPEDALYRGRRAIAEARTALATLSELAGEAQDLARRVESGRGTLGALMNDPEFARDAKAVGREILNHPWRVLGRPPEARER